MKANRVAILSQFPLIGRAIEQVLQAADDIEVIACMPDEPGAWTQVLGLHPDVVIKVGDEGTVPAALPSLWPEESLRIICLETAGNEMRLYQARQMTVTRVEDLIQAVRANGEEVGVG
jgi:chemotaxis response regulator CheB